MTSPAAASSLSFNVRDVGRRPGNLVEIERVVQVPEPIGTEVMAIAAGTPVEIAVRLESVVEGVLVSGSASSTAIGACVRCLADVTRDVRVRFQELFAYADRAAHHRAVAQHDEQYEGPRIQEDLIDLEPVLRDAVVTSLPFQPVCRDDCPGLCAQCGQPMADDPDHSHDAIDPRWSALSSLLPTPDAPISSQQSERRT